MRGALEHPEELTDRCCLSALAGLSKYLPSLGACAIIEVLLCYVKFAMWRSRTAFFHLYRLGENTVGAVGVVDWWKTLISGHTEGLAVCEASVERSTHVASGPRLGPLAVEVLHSYPQRYSIAYPQSGMVIHRRMPVIHIFMLTRVRWPARSVYCLPFLPSSSSKSSELMNSRKGESPSSSATSGSLSSTGGSSSAVFSSSSSAVVPARSKTCGST
jgi:hypothetical protein